MLPFNGQSHHSIIHPFTPTPPIQVINHSFLILSNKSPTNQEITEAHQAIADTMKDPAFIDMLIELFFMYQNSEEHPHTAKLIITTLSTYLKQQQSRNPKLIKQDRSDLNKKLLNLFLRGDIDEKLRKLIIKPYSQFIYAPGMQTIRTQTLNLLCDSVALITVNLQQSLLQNQAYFLGESFKTVLAYVYIAQLMMKGPIEQILMKSIITAFYDSIMLISLKLLQMIHQLIVFQDEHLFMKISGSCQKVIQFLKEMVLLTGKDYLYTMKMKIMRSEQIRSLIIKGLKISIKRREVIQDSQIAELAVESNGNKYIEHINEIKKSCVDIINFFAKLCVGLEKNKKEEQKKQYEMPLQLCAFFIKNAPKTLIRQFSLLQYPQKDLPHKPLYKSTINCLSQIIKILQFYSEVSKHRNSLIFELCLPLLQRRGLQDYKSAADYKGQRQDIINMHSMNICQNYACKLIESFVDRIDGSINYLSNHICDMILFHLTANAKHFQNLPEELTSSYFFKQVDYLIQIQCGLTILAIISYLAPARDQLILKIEKILYERQDFFFKNNTSSTLTAAAILCYTYYVDNFYLFLKEKKSSMKTFHLEVLSFCCIYIKQFSRLQKQNNNQNKLKRMSQQILALQALDCINNSITQKLFIQALFWDDGAWNQNNYESTFMNMFNFFVDELQHSLNINVIDILVEFFAETIKNHCTKGFAIRRFQYQYKGIPLIIRSQLCNEMAANLCNIFSNKEIPNYMLMKCKIMNLFELIFTCCENPDEIMSNQFYSLINEDDKWFIFDSIDIYLRRMIEFKKQGKIIKNDMLLHILKRILIMLPEIKQTYEIKNIFGIVVNLILLNDQIIDSLAVYMSKFLIQLLEEEDQIGQFSEELQNIIEKFSYINLISIYNRFNQLNKEVWCNLAENIENFLAARSTRGILSSRSAPYIGKLLAICLVCLYNMRFYIDYSNNQKTKLLLSNIIRTSQIYTTVTEKQIIASTIIDLLDSKVNIDQNDEECKQCFVLISQTLYLSYSKMFYKPQNNGDEKFSDEEDEYLSDSDQSIKNESSLKYKAYSIKSNEYTRKEGKQKYLIKFKNLCYKLKTQSYEFLKKSMNNLSIPIKNFITEQIFFFQENIPYEGMRKVVKIKKQTN